MWVRARPKAEHDALLISFVGMMYKRDIQLLLHLGVVLSMPFREAEQRLVARVIGKRVCKLMVRGQIDAQPTKSFKECGVIAVEQITETNPPRIGTPFQEQIEEVSSSSAQGQIQRAVRLQVEIVAITHKNQDQRLVPCFERDLEGGGHVPLTDLQFAIYLQRLACLDPVLDVVEAVIATQAV